MNRSLRGLAIAVVLPLSAFGITGCGASGVLDRCVPAGGAAVGANELVGTYRGVHDAAGARLTLSLGPGQHGGTLTVDDWPTGTYYRAELGKTFKGSGTWVVDTRSQGHPLVRLSFTQPHDWLPGDTVDRLTVAADSTRTVLYEDSDPDTCPDFRLDLARAK
ncbi:hypothetical protein ACFV98_01580 [Streptomyces violascens]|uniref:hypothetical protein n=1 Tax=Streptomyces violascens TaxID=67381 RepID=UPI00365722EA